MIFQFSRAASWAVHLELTESQEAEEFLRKLNSFIGRRGRPRLMIPDNAGIFKTTGDSTSRDLPGGRYSERFIREKEKTLYKTLGRSRLSFKNLETVLMDIEINMNIRPLTYVKSDGEEEEVLTPKVLIRGRNTCLVDDMENDADELTMMQKRVVRSQREYGHFSIGAICLRMRLFCH